jgi:hypothetical protein
MISVQSEDRASFDTAAGPGVKPPLARRVVARVLHEARDAVLPTLFFFVGFNLIVLTTNLLVAQYSVAVSNFMLATLGALVVGQGRARREQPCAYSSL